MKNTIKFSHNYPKLWGQAWGRLLKIQYLKYPNDFDKDLVEYDTKTTSGEYYKLAKGNYMQLIFVGNKGIPFCTIRRWTPQKEEYYLGLVGQLFAIEVSK